MVRVTVDNITKFFGKTEAVKGVSLEASEEILTLLGPSGCGKTTTLRCIAGLENPDQGEIRIGDAVVSSPSKGIFVPPEKRGIGFVFQSYALWPHMKVFDNVGFGLKLRNTPKDEVKKRVNQALETVGLAGLEDRYPSQLSGGQQQRVALARSLAYEPKVLLLDEPLSNLDAKLRERTRTDLRQLLTKLGMTSIYVTHDQEEASVISDKIILMNNGVIIQTGTPQSIYERPEDEFVADFIGSANLTQGTIMSKDTGGKLGTVVAHELGDSQLRCHVPENFDVSDSCLLIMRSNELGVSREKPESDLNVLEGEVLVREYKGPVTDHRVRVGEKELIVTTHRFCSLTRGTQHHGRVYVAVPPESITVLQIRRPVQPG